ncbi:PUA-like domain-containing protein [Schizothecium vesticola]|uniref:Thymocyte nuclear protein 1 n=1 Tax=Schizothecium vesticola TaxID=314040 RepID=A0AA40BPS4_9PEZI|nr:PUA-like domain-containing protein [Schizothecium vesticola]
MSKRKSTAAEVAVAEARPRRSLRNAQPASEPEPVAASTPAAKELKTVQPKNTPKAVVKKGGRKTPQKVEEESAKAPTPKTRPKKASSADAKPQDKDTDEKTYWLLKAEPESRFENGVDVRFSIDDLAAKTVPEPWDGIRAYAARNNLRAMKKGDLAFFYHSNIKEPGIVGTMEIVEEHSPDLSAHDPKAPYYDASSKPSDPKWSVVHVEFRSKFTAPIGLKELRQMGEKGKPLENMQMLKQTRLSVSKVSAAEWEYLMSVAEERGAASQK